MMSKTDEYRARMEEYEFLRAAVPASDRRRSDNVFEWTLRYCLDKFRQFFFVNLRIHLNPKHSQITIQLLIMSTRM